ncbi:MAG TPA: glycosyltransferase [Candidatus Limnocylindrales bacterium]|nr:glycosyltransferase [Candidatus Limnocylindrales bacterium]
MRVLLTSESFLPYLSGVTVSVDALARSLGARGHQVLVLAPEPARGAVVESVGSPGPAPEYAWLPSYQLPSVVPPGYRMPWPLPWTDAMAAATAFGPDVVHAHSPFVTGLMARRVAAAAGAPLVFTHHTRFADYRHYLGPLAGPGAWLADAYLRTFWGACAGIVAPSHDLAAEIRDRLPAARRGRVHVVPTGVDVDGLRALAPIDPRTDAGWPPSSVVAASLGRLAPEKSPMELLQAAAIAMRDTPELRLLLVGGGPSESELRRRAAAPDLAGRVHFTGRRPRPEALARAAGADLFVFASRSETQGLVLAEALALGLPALAVDGPGVRDSVRDGIDGVIVPLDPADTRAQRLGAAVVALAADPQRRRAMAERARADAGRFSVATRAAEMEEVYRRAAD